MINPQLEEAKSSVDAFELPCGYLDSDGTLHTHVEVREITGDEEEILGAKNMTPLKKMNKVLASCTLAVGPYTDPKKIAALIPDLTQGDRVYLLIAIRRVSLGDDFPFTTQCPNCEQKSNLTVSLADLEIKKMPDPKVRTYDLLLNKTKKKLSMKVLTGHGEEAIGRASAVGKDVVSVAMLARIDAMDGLPADIGSVKKLPLADRNQIRDAWQDREGGVDTEVEIVCPQCDHEYKSDVDLASEGFFNPLAVSKHWKSSAS